MRGDGAFPFEQLDKLAAIRNRTFTNQAELVKWLGDNAVATNVCREAIKQVPTTRELANDVVLCFDALTGAVKWRVQIPGQPVGWDSSVSPCIDNDRCYLLMSGGTFYCLDMKSSNVV